ncbi:MAG: protein kinase [Polyangiaceae bacterium]|nr:protein kinase [Polyangiaceae bacterium]
MGEVFAAENIRTGRPVAVKLLRADSKSKSSAVERFRREARAAGSINSDHVTQVLDVEDDSEHGIVIVFELLEGESLIDRLKRLGPISFEELHPIIEEVWVGLSDAHKAGIIHRDLKPSNVFLERRPDGQQRVKLLDFGISKLPKEMGGETLTEMGQSLGTFSFMPPEQIGRAKTVDHRADIYATTTMIYQALTGQLPYLARNILIMVDLKSKQAPRPLAEAMGHPVDDRLEAFISKGLARNPADRFQNALEALEEWRALKNLVVPESRRAVLTSMDLNAQAQSAQRPKPPIPAAGRPAAAPAVVPRVGTSTMPSNTGMVPRAVTGTVPSITGMTAAMAPAPVVPAAMLEPVIPASLPKLYDHTESTTDMSAQEMADAAAHESGVQPVGGPDPRAISDNAERRGPQGTRVLPPSVVQDAVAAAEARRAAGTSSQSDLRISSQSAQSLPTSSQQVPSVHGSQSHQAVSSGAPGVYTPRSAAMQALGATTPMQAPPGPATPLPASGAHPVPTARSPGQSSSSAPPPARGSGVHPMSPAVPAALNADSSANMGRMPPQTPTSTTGPGHSMPMMGGMMLPLPPAQGSAMAPVPLHMADDGSSTQAGAGDKTTVYRPKKKAPEKKTSLWIYALGAILFAILGFGLVYFVVRISQSK